MEFETGIEVFVRAFCFTKSFTHPYVGEKFGDVWLMRDGPGRIEARTWEWVTHRAPFRQVVEKVRETGSARHAICMLRTMDESDVETRKAAKALGYRLLGSEGFFVHRLEDLPRRKVDFPIVRVMDAPLADRLAKAARSRQILPEHLGLEDAPLRQYVALSGKTPVGWVRSISVCGATWCSNLYVERAFRRKGIGAALMSRMLDDDVRFGSNGSVLLASHAGAMLYPQLGFEQIGELLLFVPQKKWLSP